MYAQPCKACWRVFSGWRQQTMRGSVLRPQAYACPSRTCGIAGQGQMLAIAPPLNMRPCAQGGGGQGARGAFRGHFSGLAAWHWCPQIIYDKRVVTFSIGLAVRGL